MNAATWSAIVAAGIAAFGLLVGGGILTRYVKRSNDDAVNNYIVTENARKVEEVMQRVTRLETTSTETVAKVSMLEDRLKALDLIPQLSERLSALEGIINNVSDLVNTLVSQKQ